MQNLLSAYQIIFGRQPDKNLMSWQVAQKFVNKFDGRKLSYKQSILAINDVVNGLIEFPSQKIKQKIILCAEALASEIEPDLPDEPHMADIEWLTRKIQE